MIAKSNPRSTSRTLACLIVASSVIGFHAPSVSAQFIQVETPLQNVNDSYWERHGVDFGFSLRGGQGNGTRIVGLLPNGQLNPSGDIVFSQNGISSAVPQFGGFDPNSQASTGAGIIGPNGTISLGFLGGKGSTRSNTTRAPFVVVPNGGTGSVFSGQNRPFVTGINPVTGGGGGTTVFMPPVQLSKEQLRSLEPVPRPPVEEAIVTYSDPHSSAAVGDLSLAEISSMKNDQAANQNSKLRAELHKLITDANDLMDQGKFGAARAKYGRAIRKIGDDVSLQTLREQISAKLTEIKSKR